MRRRWANPYIHIKADPLSNNQILYTTTDGNTVDVTEDGFEANLIQNAYVDGLGILTFDSSITSIGKNSFKSCGNLKTINLPQSVTEIGSNAFYMCTSLSDISFPDNLLTIGSSAFYGCISLSKLNIPNTVTDIGSYAFDSCFKLFNVTIPDSVVSLSSYCFNNCVNLNEVDLGRGIESINAYMFLGCTNLLNVYIGENVSSIETTAFSKCPNLHTLSFKCINIPDFGFNEQYTTIYETRTLITTINLEPTVLSIQKDAFYNFTSLKTVNVFTNQLKTIESSAFYNCKNISFIDLSKLSLLLSIKSYAFYNCGTSESVKSFTVILPDNITETGIGVFQTCTKLKEINIPKKLKILGERLFEDCTSLKEIKLPEGMTELGRNAFKNCTSLKKINIPKSLKTVKLGCFQNVDLDTIDLADINSYLSIQYSQTNSADYSCYPANNGAVFTLNGNAVTEVIILPSCKLIPSHAFHWKKNKKCTINSVKIKDETKPYYFSIGDYAFYNCNNPINLQLYEVKKDTTVTDIHIEIIGKYAFAYCTLNLLSSIYNSLITGYSGYISSISAKTIEEGAFYKCVFPLNFLLLLSADTLKTNSFYNVKFKQEPDIQAFVWKFEKDSCVLNSNYTIVLNNSSIVDEGGGENVVVDAYAFNPNTVTVKVGYMNRKHYVKHMESWLSKDRIKGFIAL